MGAASQIRSIHARGCVGLELVGDRGTCRRLGCLSARAVLVSVAADAPDSGGDGGVWQLRPRTIVGCRRGVVLDFAVAPSAAVALYTSGTTTDIAHCATGAAVVLSWRCLVGLNSRESASCDVDRHPNGVPVHRAPSCRRCCTTCRCRHRPTGRNGSPWRWPRPRTNDHAEFRDRVTGVI